MEDIAVDLAVVAAFVIAYALVSQRLSTTVITGPMAFVAFGVLVGPDGFGLVNLRVEHELLRVLAETTLALLLFNEAALLKWPLFWSNRQTPLRLIGLGLPLSILFGAAAAALIFDGFDIWQGALIGAILAPTDAALGQAVVTNERVPVRIREALSAEGGLNDGIAAPFVTMFIAATAAAGAFGSGGFWILYLVEQIGFGLLFGLGAGFVGAVLIGRASSSGWMSQTFLEIAVASLPILAFASAVLIDGNGFIAAFVAGITYGNVTRDLKTHMFDFSEQTSQILMLLTFMFFGGAFFADAMGEITWQIALYGVLSLVLIRPLAVGLAMIGTHFRPSTVAFLGWFRPRGLASIVFAVLVIETEGVPGQDQIFLIATWTVFLSVYAHGLTAQPGADSYAKLAEAIPTEAGAPELDEVEKAFRSVARFVSGGRPPARKAPPEET